MAKQYQKPSSYINFASGWMRLDDDGTIKTINCKIDHKKNAKNNYDKETKTGQGYKIFVYPTNASGDITGDGQEVTEFFMRGSGADKSQYEHAPDFTVTIPVY